MLFAEATLSFQVCSATNTPLSDNIISENGEGSCVKSCSDVVRLHKLGNEFCSQMSPVMQNKAGVCSPRSE